MHDVVIVGGGPVGLFLAGELALGGCSVLVLERQAEPHSPWRRFPLGLRGLNAGSVEAFYRRGMLAELLAASGGRDEVGADLDAERAPAPRSVSHFAGIMLDAAKVDLAALPPRLPSPAVDGMLTSLDAVESVLAARAIELGVELRRGVEVTGLTQHDETVVVHAGEQEYQGLWVVGCDGGRSTVRRLAGFAFTGTEPALTGYLFTGAVTGREKLGPGFTVTPTGMYLRMPAGGYLGMMDFDGGAFDRSQPLTPEHLQTVLRRVSGTDVTVDEVDLASSFTDRAMQATTYRQGRVLLAGDAAHIHSPLGGQGLNLGIGDALNLGWKLAATVHGTAPDGLLDTYTAERHPIGARVLDWSRAQVAVMRPDRYAPSLQSLIGDLLATADATTYVWERTSGLANRYDLGDDQPLTGRNAPDLRLGTGTLLGTLLQSGRGVLLDFSADQVLHEAATGWTDRIDYVAGPARDDLGHGAVLVRPDGVVAWADGRSPDSDAFDRAARRWFGDPKA
ncbi:FAD-dependent oxidoreductase [Actinoplanes cyaneus]|uniref:FAD-dependent oxidoreductase n=1 Tax=Actinoplanes cyaneus TaxID=52696 RepID=A0A919IT86_9ACTN|nr:FAD-dependent oxidoreductase [Actinoplanes cyaneus]MCW2143883.1 2-polyprenyl-6-methoxyphenol hydroxylase [Actinoplanes cyaneus]GID70616.1 FAD-dependent oxidoreductase [Actinoplanes cyaneus]